MPANQSGQPRESSSIWHPQRLSLRPAECHAGCSHACSTGQSLPRRRVAYSRGGTPTLRPEAARTEACGTPPQQSRGIRPNIALLAARNKCASSTRQKPRSNQVAGKTKMCRPVCQCEAPRRGCVSQDRRSTCQVILPLATAWMQRRTMRWLMAMAMTRPSEGHRRLNFQ